MALMAGEDGIFSFIVGLVSFVNCDDTTIELAEGWPGKADLLLLP
jgi:hypothetical protein